MEELGVGLPRLLKDFADPRGRISLGELVALTEWLGVGLTKVQLRKIVSVYDQEKEGFLRIERLA
jgi:Ca2+-binding EF-hand superfamily protein